MSRTICIFEDARFVDLFPLSLAQPVFDLRIGTGTLRARWEPGFERVSLLCRDYLADTAAHVLSANPAVNNRATDITVTDPVTVAQATTIDGFTNSGANTYSVVDSAANERLYLFAEVDARMRGCELRRFDTPDAALEWLWGKPVK